MTESHVHAVPLACRRSHALRHWAVQVLCLASSREHLPWQWAGPLSPTAEMFGVPFSPLGQRLVGPCTPKSRPAGNFTACLCRPVKDRTRLRQHKHFEGSLEESLLETVLLKREVFKFCY